MKRHPVLQDLSRDHHHALVVAQRLRQTAENDATEAGDAFLHYWRTDGERHFRVEEEILLPGFARAGGEPDQLVARVLHDHAEIRLEALRMQSRSSSAEAQQELGQLLARHVRLEERELFPAIEAALSDEELVRLGAAISAAERRN